MITLEDIEVAEIELSAFDTEPDRMIAYRNRLHLYEARTKYGGKEWLCTVAVSENQLEDQKIKGEDYTRERALVNFKRMFLNHLTK